MQSTLTTILTGGAIALALAVVAAPSAEAGSKSKGYYGHHSSHYWKSYNIQPYPYFGYNHYYYKPATFGITPWTPGWYAYCKGKYKSFNPSTGMYLSYNGQYYFCK